MRTQESVANKLDTTPFNWRLALLLLMSLSIFLFTSNQAHGAITYFNSASNPTDNGSSGSSPTAVAPPASMVAGDLVILIGNSRENSGTLAISQAGGQTWTSQTANSTQVSQRIFWARFNGTWSANPSVSSNKTKAFTVVMHVFRPSASANTWAIDVAQINAQYTKPAPPGNVTITGITTLTNGALVFANWASTDNNAYTLQTSDWANAGSAQYRNDTNDKDSSQSSAYKIMSTAGATGNVTNQQTSAGDDKGNTSILAFKEVSVISIANNSLVEGNSGTTNLTFTVSLSAASATNITASYATSNLTATGGGACSGATDYITTTGTVTILAGATLGTITVPICGDATNESDETFTVTLSSPTNATLGSSSAIGTITNDDSAISSFNAFETSTASGAITGKLYTKLAGTAFSVDVVAITASNTVSSGFSGNVKLELLANTTPGSSYNGSNCPTSSTTLQTISSAAISSGRSSVSGFSVANAYRDVRVRISYPTTSPTIIICAADSFAIRPQSLSITSSNANADNTGVSTSATPKIKAGASFAFDATALSGYNGTPSIDNTKLTAHSGAVRNGSVTGTFNAATSGTGIANGTTFSYDDVGYFRFSAQGVYDDTFASIDQSASDCTNDFSNSLVSGKYGCKFGNTANTNYFGRFYPDHFAISTGAITPGCGTSTYFGQDGVTTAFTLSAKNASNVTTQNYTGSFAKLDLTSWSAFNFTSNAPLGSSLSASATAPSGTWSSGATNSLQAKHIIGRPTSLPATPGTSSVTISAAPTDSDGVTMSSAAISVATNFYYGRLHLLNAYGSDLLPIRVPIQTEYYNGTNWVINTSDTCTTIAANSLKIGSIAKPSGSSLAFATPASGVTVSAITSGIGALTISPSTKGFGSADLVLNLGGAVTTTSCSTLTSAIGGSAPTSSLDYLAGQWCGTSYNKAPIVRIKFGSPKAPYIYLRERY